MLVESVRADSVDQILYGLLNLVILAFELLRLGIDPLRLHLNELIESVGGGVGGQVDKDSLGEGLEVVLNSVLHDVIDVNDELLKL